MRGSCGLCRTPPMKPCRQRRAWATATYRAVTVTNFVPSAQGPRTRIITGRSRPPCCNASVPTVGRLCARSCLLGGWPAIPNLADRFSSCGQGAHFGDEKGPEVSRCMPVVRSKRLHACAANHDVRNTPMHASRPRLTLPFLAGCLCGRQAGRHIRRPESCRGRMMSDRVRAGWPRSRLRGRSSCA